MEKIFNFLDEKEKKRKLLIHIYVSEFGPLITDGDITANTAMMILAEKHGTSRANIYRILRKCGAYKDAKNPVIPDVDNYEELINKQIDLNLCV